VLEKKSTVPLVDVPADIAGIPTPNNRSREGDLAMQAPIVHTNLRQSMFAKKKNLNDCSPVSPGNSNKLAHLPTSSD
jgi:hypothetical protein